MKDFFAPEDLVNYPACGMFTLPHIIALIISLCLIVFFVYKCKNIGKEKTILLIKIFGIVFTILEIGKIIYNFYYGYTLLINWFPFSFCSLYIYSCLIAGFGKGKVREVGLSFLVCGGIVAGFTFLVMPTTSLMLHPMFHFLSIHSMVFHTVMVFTGIICYTNGLFEINKKGFRYYLIFSSICLIIALIINIIFNENMMFIMYPYNIPIDFIHVIAQKALPVYVLCACCVYIFIPYFVSYIFCNKMIYKLKK